MILDVEAVKESSRVCIEEWGKALERLNEEERRYKEKFRSIRRKIRETEKEIRAEKENELKYLTLCDKLAVQKELAAAMEEVLRNISRCQKKKLLEGQEECPKGLCLQLIVAKSSFKFSLNLTFLQLLESYKENYGTFGQYPDAMEELELLSD